MVTDLFTVMEQKLEMVLSQFGSLKEANAALQKSLAEKEQALVGKEQALKEAEAAWAKISQEREVVRQRIDKILNRLEILDTGESA